MGWLHAAMGSGPEGPEGFAFMPKAKGSHKDECGTM